VINSISGKKEDYFDANSWWVIKEMKFTDQQMPGYAESGNYAQSMIVQVYKHSVYSDDREPTCNLISVDLTYMGL